MGPTAALLTLLLTPLLQPPSPARAFGTVRGLDQRAEHERITRAALACAPGVKTNGDCFEERSIDQLAGMDGTFGAVGAPDSDDQILEPEAHCDDVDYLDVPGYPQSRSDAAKVLQKCIDHLRDEFKEARKEAEDLLNKDGSIDLSESALVVNCVFTGGAPGRAKCDVLQGLGRALHGVQDFYAHSNWADEADPTRPIGIDNPPGLNLPGPSPLLDLRGSGTVTPPDGFTTGFFKSPVPGEDACPGVDGRVTHACLNKDKEQIDFGPGMEVNGVMVAGLGGVSDPLTPRGLVQSNALEAVAGAVSETRRQWNDFRAELIERYGQPRGGRMILALTSDGPSDSILPMPDMPPLLELPSLPERPSLPGFPGRP